MKAAGLPPMFVLIIVAGSAMTARAYDFAELDDAAARIQYGYFTGDARALEQGLERLQSVRLPQAHAHEAMKHYHLAYGYWKLAQTFAERAADGERAFAARAARAAGACEKAAEQAVSADARLAEAHAMRAICASLASRVPSILTFGDCTRHKALRTARELTPGNVRVRLIEILCELGGNGTGLGRLGRGKDVPALLARVQALVDDFAAATPTRPGRLDWGHADALLLLGRLHWQLGQRIAARDAFERALAIAPEYLKARAALDELARHEP